MIWQRPCRWRIATTSQTRLTGPVMAVIQPGQSASACVDENAQSRWGEDMTNVIPSAAVALRTCTVSFTGPSGIRHSIDVTAESVYEAAALGVSALRETGWAEVVALGTELEVQVRQPPTCHRITVRQIHRWCDGIAVSPDETLKKRKLKQLLA